MSWISVIIAGLESGDLNKLLGMDVVIPWHNSMEACSREDE